VAKTLFSNIEGSSAEAVSQMLPEFFTGTTLNKNARQRLFAPGKPVFSEGIPLRSIPSFPALLFIR
jgi:hypothetical protein